MQAKVKADSLIDKEQKLGFLASTQANSARAANLERLATYYDTIKPTLAAERLQEDEFREDDVASILGKSTPAKAGKIMGFMEPDLVARITKMIMMQNLDRLLAYNRARHPMTWRLPDYFNRRRRFLRLDYHRLS